MDLIKKYFPDLNFAQIERFKMLKPLYTEWNSKINVISRKDIDKLYERHILHSLGIAKVIEFKSGTTVLDVGSGGGFPGIPLAIMFPESNFHLIDSIGKKIKVVEEVVNELELKNVTFEKIRAEDVDGKFDFVVSRAVTSLPVFYKWVRKSILKKNINSLQNGILYLKGGDVKSEISELMMQVNIYPLSRYFKEPFFETKKLVHIIS